MYKWLHPQTSKNLYIYMDFTSMFFSSFFSMLIVPISCDDPQINGRNWWSSSAHTPWDPAGSIRYTVCKRRTNSIYLGTEKTTVKHLLNIPPRFHWISLENVKINVTNNVYKGIDTCCSQTDSWMPTNRLMLHCIS